MTKLDVTTHGDTVPQSVYDRCTWNGRAVVCSTGASESPEERRERLKAEWDDIIDWHLNRQTFEAWCQDGSGELVPEYLERMCREALEDILDRAKYMSTCQGNTGGVWHSGPQKGSATTDDARRGRQPDSAGLRWDGAEWIAYAKERLGL